MKKRIGALCLSIAMCMFLLVGCAEESKTEQESNVQNVCELTFLETGKSDCILIEIEGTVIINDTADEDDYYAIVNLLEEEQITTIDYMILSHFDKDHIGSAAKILQKYDVETVIMPGYWGDSILYQNMIAALQSSDTEQVILGGDDSDYVISIAEDATVSVNGPKESSYKDENNYSLITTVEYKDTSILLTGDALKARMDEFLEQIDLSATEYQLIKMPHHGDYYKKIKELVEATTPEYAVITDDEQNERLEDKLLTILSENNCEALFTNQGDIRVVSDGEQLTVTQK